MRLDINKMNYYGTGSNNESSSIANTRYAVIYLTPEALRDLNKVISDYFVQMADAELDRMWNEGTLNEERIESFRHLHERTPYNKPIL